MKRLQRVLAFTAVFACLSAELACRPTKVLSASDNVMSESSVLAADTVVDLTPIFPDKAGGTKENPYTISSAYEFTALIRAAKTSSLENVYFVQVCDIVFNEDDAFALNDGILSVAEGKRVLSSYPIASDSNYPFKGSFDGNGYKLRGMVLRAQNGVSGLFGYTETASIKNVCIENSILNLCAASGGIVANAATTTVSGCTFEGTAAYDTTTGYLGSYAGGIVGKADSESAIQKCENRAVFNLTKSPMECFVGGIVGSADGFVTSCCNRGAFHVVSSIGTVSCGGIAGEVTETGNINNCQNFAAADGKISNYVARLYLGGIVGQNQGTLRAVRNRAPLSAAGYEGYPCYLGGIVGYNLNGTVSASDNRAKLDGIVSYTGGIAGTNYANGASASLSDCLNAGEVNSTDYPAGGLVGWNGASGSSQYKGVSTIKNSVNTDTRGNAAAAFGASEVRNNASAITEHLYAVDKTQDTVTTMSLAELAAAESLDGLSGTVWSYPNGFAPAPVIVKQNSKPEIVGLWTDHDAARVAFAAVTKKALNNAQFIIACYKDGRLIDTTSVAFDMAVGTNVYTVNALSIARADKIRITAFGSLATLTPITDMDRF